MAVKYDLTATAWTLIASRGNPSLRFRGPDRARIFIGSTIPAVGSVDYVTLEPTRGPVTFGQLAGGRRMWARADAGGAVLEVEDSGGGAEAVARLLSAAAGVNATLVKNAPGRLFRLIGRNNAAAIRYLKLYDKASAPTVGTDVPVLTLPLAASANFDIAFGELGHHFATGIGYALTVNGADADTTALTAADVLALNVIYG